MDYRILLSRRLSVIAATFLAALLAGCYVPRIHKSDTYDAESGVQTLAIDAKQRVVVFGRRPAPDKTIAKALAEAAAAAGSRDLGLIPVTCAEPSPDAMSALSTSLGGAFSDPKVAANFAISQAESEASIGLRTQSIQLLRDGMYRLCEGYAAGAVSAEDFNKQQRRYQNLMLSLLAIEQLTGAVVAKQATLGQGEASTSVADKADQAEATLSKANSDLSAAQSTLTQAQETQTADNQACKANSASANCTKAAQDQADVADAQKALNKATVAQQAAQAAMLASRSAVTTDAKGAVVQLSGGSGTSPISEGTARYIAEATRTIVSTTLLASFAQEECTNMWSYVNSLSEDDQRNFFLKSNAEAWATRKVTVKDESTEVVDQSQFIHLLKNCQHSQDVLFQQTGFFIPQYGSTSTSFRVLSGEGPVTLALGGAPTNFIVVGGVAPYHLSDLSPDLAKEVTATLAQQPSGGLSQLTLTRPDGATKTSGKGVVYVVDGASAVAEVPFTLAPKAAKAPETSPAPTAKITGVTFASGKFTVKFTAPASAANDTFVGWAINTNKAKGDQEIGDAAEGATQVDISGCTAGDSYSILLGLVTESGTVSVIKYGTPAKCGTPAATPGAPAKPDPPKITDVTAAAGGKFTVTFAAPAKDGGSPVTGYTAQALDEKAGQKPVPPVSTKDGTVTPITLSGCTAGDSYVVTVFATNKLGNAPPAKAAKAVKCLK